MSCHTHTQSGSQVFLSSEAVGDRQQPDSPSAQLRKMGTEELSTSFSTAGVTEETETQRHTGQRWRFKVLFVRSSTVIGMGENMCQWWLRFRLTDHKYCTHHSLPPPNIYMLLTKKKAIRDETNKELLNLKNGHLFDHILARLLTAFNPAGHLSRWSERLFSVSKLSAWRGTGQPFVYPSRAQELRAKWAPKPVKQLDQEGDMRPKITPNLLIPRKRRLPSSMNSSLSG